MYISARGVGDGPGRAVIRLAVMRFVNDKTLFRYDEGDTTASLILSDFTSQARRANIMAAGFICGVHIVILKAGPIPVEALLCLFAMSGCNMNALDIRSIKAHDPVKYQALLPWYQRKPEELHTASLSSELGRLFAACELYAVSPTSFAACTRLTHVQSRSIPV